MTDAAVATDVHQSLDVQLNGRAELAFDLESLLGDGVTDRGDLVVAPLLNLQFGIHVGLFEDRQGGAATDPVDIGQPYIPSFISR